MKARLSPTTAKKRLADAGLEFTEHRLLVLLVVGNSPQPISAPEILETIRTQKEINRVTVYRILDLLVTKKVLNRLGLGEKLQRFCLRGTTVGDDHAHFHCLRCDRYLCLSAPAIPINTQALADISMDIEHVDIRLDGICPACKKRA